MKRGGYVRRCRISNRTSKVRAVALYNPSDSVCSFRVPLEILELAGKTRVRDLVKRKDEGRVTGSFQYDVPAHGVKILRMEGEERLEPVRYEAEQAYLHQFDNLAKRPRGWLICLMRELPEACLSPIWAVTGTIMPVGTRCSAKRAAVTG